MVFIYILFFGLNCSRLLTHSNVHDQTSLLCARRLTTCPESDQNCALERVRWGVGGGEKVHFSGFSYGTGCRSIMEINVRIVIKAFPTNAICWEKCIADMSSTQRARQDNKLPVHWLVNMPSMRKNSYWLQNMGCGGFGGGGGWGELPQKCYSCRL